LSSQTKIFKKLVFAASLLDKKN